MCRYKTFWEYFLYDVVLDFYLKVKEYINGSLIITP